MEHKNSVLNFLEIPPRGGTVSRPMSFRKANVKKGRVSRECDGERKKEERQKEHRK